MIGARKDAANEDWLVCVTSDHGGTDDGRYGGSSEAERDIFGIFYYDHYTPFEMKGESFYAARFRLRNGLLQKTPRPSTASGQTNSCLWR